MFLTDDVLRFDHADSRQVWRLPLRQIRAVEADVAERWMVNVRMPLRRFREIVPPLFLEPLLVDGSLLLALCAIRMRHAAPLWAPLSLGPASMNCALRVACRDQRDGRSCVWVTQRYTDNGLAPALAHLGFPSVAGGLVDRGGPGCLDFMAGDGLIQVQARPGKGSAPELFTDAATLDSFLNTGVRSYSPGRGPGRWAVIEREQRIRTPFTHCAAWEGWLRTPWGDCTIDGIYRTVDGLYRWTGHGEVDDRGTPL
jgi:hypothetical protein